VLVTLGLTIGARREARKADIPHNRVLIATAVALVPISMVLITAVQFRGPWAPLITVTVMSCALVIGILMDFGESGPPYLPFFCTLLGCYIALIVTPMIMLVARPDLYIAGSGFKLAVEKGVSVFTVTMMGVITPGLIGYVLANRRLKDQPQPVSIARFVRRWLFGLSIGLLLPLLAVITKLTSLMYAGALLGFLLAAGSGEGRRLLSAPLIPGKYDAAAERVRLGYDRAIVRARFGRAFLVLGGYALMIALFRGYVSFFPTIQGDTVPDRFGIAVGALWELVIYPIGAATVVGLPAAAVHAFGPYLVDRLQQTSRKVFAGLGVAMTSLGVLITIMSPFIKQNLR
jgi:hypothetical protein